MPCLLSLLIRVLSYEKSKYTEKPEKVPDCEKLRKLEKSWDCIVMKYEKEPNKKLLDMRKKGKIPVKVYETLRSTGGQPARLYGLFKVHKKENPLRPVFSPSREVNTITLTNF